MCMSLLCYGGAFFTGFSHGEFRFFSAFKDLLCDHVFLIFVHESIETLHVSFPWSKDVLITLRFGLDKFVSFSRFQLIFFQAQIQIGVFLVGLHLVVWEMPHNKS